MHPRHSENALATRPWQRVTLLLLIALLSSARIATTWGVFSQTADEPTHVVCGFEWLTTDGYALDPEHPPLARIGFGLAAWLEGAVWREDLGRVARGTELLYRNGEHRHNLWASRAANIPFFLLGFFAVYAWARRLFGDGTALIAATLYGTLPPVLAHAGLATTDMAASATVVAALYALECWLTDRTWTRAAILGVAIGIGLLSKFSFAVFFPVGAIVLLVANVRGGFLRRVTSTLGQLSVAILIAFFLVWAGYKFSTGTLNETRLKVLPPESVGQQAARYATYPGYEWVRPDLVVRYWDYANDAARHGVRGVDIVDWAKAAGYPSPAAGRAGNTLAGGPPVPRPPLRARVLEPFRAAWQWIAVRVPVPAPYFVVGAEYVRHHSAAGHPAFLLGRYHDQGWWYYFPVLLFYKTPLAFLVAAVAGLILLRRRAVAYVPLLMLVAALTSRINIGVRHILPLYPLLAIVAAYAAVALWRKSRPAAVILLGWYFVAGAIAHPDYLPYFNELARRPETIATDSNLDWGQDLLRLEKVVREERIEHLYISYFGTAPWDRHVPGEVLPRDRRVRGWVAVSEMEMKFGGEGNRGSFHWLEEYEPVRRVGKSIRLYRIP